MFDYFIILVIRSIVDIPHWQKICLVGVMSNQLLGSKLPPKKDVLSV